MIVDFRRYLLICITLLICWSAGSFGARGDEAVRRTGASRLLIDGEVRNSNTGELIPSFRVLPGVRYNRGRAGRDSVTVWQPHMIREMKDGIFEWPRTRGYDEMRFRVEANGYRPATTTWLGKGGPHLRMKVHLRPDDGIDGIVLTPDGEPAAGAVLAIGMPGRSIRLEGCKIADRDLQPGRLSDQWRQPVCVETDDSGYFKMPYETDGSAVLCVVHELGYVEHQVLELANRAAKEQSRLEIQLLEWGRVTGQVLWKDTPGIGETLRATLKRDDIYPGLISAFISTQSDAKGHYRFDYLPPGSVSIGHKVTPPLVDVDNLNVKRTPKDVGSRVTYSSGPVYEYPAHRADIQSGRNAKIDFGGAGIQVTGKLNGLRSYDGVTIEIRPPSPDVWGMGGRRIAQSLQKGYADLGKTTYGPLYFRKDIPVAADGSFTIPATLNGAYNLWVRGATGSLFFNVEPSAESPLEIGTIQVKPLNR